MVNHHNHSNNPDNICSDGMERFPSARLVELYSEIDSFSNPFKLINSSLTQKTGVDVTSFKTLGTLF